MLQNWKYREDARASRPLQLQETRLVARKVDYKAYLYRPWSHFFPGELLISSLIHSIHFYKHILTSVFLFFTCILSDSATNVFSPLVVFFGYRIIGLETFK